MPSLSTGKTCWLSSSASLSAGAILWPSLRRRTQTLRHRHQNWLCAVVLVNAPDNCPEQLECDLLCLSARYGCALLSPGTTRREADLSKPYSGMAAMLSLRTTPGFTEVQNEASIFVERTWITALHDDIAVSNLDASSMSDFSTTERRHSFAAEAR